MSEGGFHVHGPHDHAVEHEAQHGDGFAGRIAVMTAIFATIGALFGYMGGATQNDALLFKNDAAIKKTEASDQWNFYQAKSSKGHLMELAADITGGKRAEAYKQKLERYEQEKKEIRAKAEALEAESHAANMKSEHLLHPLHLTEQAMTLIQIAISLASITVLTRKKWLFAVAGTAAAGGLALWIASYFV
jgi:hypothetical protein